MFFHAASCPARKPRRCSHSGSLRRSSPSHVLRGPSTGHPAAEPGADPSGARPRRTDLFERLLSTALLIPGLRIRCSPASVSFVLDTAIGPHRARS